MDVAHPAEQARHRAAVTQERAERDERLRDPMGWFSLVGLHWLRPGRQRFGSDPDGDVVLASAQGEVPLVAGTIEVGETRVLLHPEPGGGLMVAGVPVSDGLELADDEAEVPTVVELASLRLVVIRRHGGRAGLRVKDVAAPAVRRFHGLDHFPIDPAWRLTGRLVRPDPPGTLAVPDVFGEVEELPAAGVVELEIAGVSCRLHALEAMPGHLWLLFADRTNGRETYGAGRFLVTGAVQPDDTVEVDFNLAYNPPCSFTPYATCPLPPAENRLPVRVEAGERAWVPPAG